MVVSFDVPNFVQAATDFTDFASSLQSPLTQGLLAAGGINPFTGERHTEDPTENLRKAYAAVNPYQYPKVYNKIVLPYLTRFSQKQPKL